MVQVALNAYGDIDMKKLITTEQLQDLVEDNSTVVPQIVTETAIETII